MNTRLFVLSLFCLLESVCYGFSIIEEERIINGEDTDISSVPYIVSVRINDEHICGSAIINENCVLTAAHCISHDDFDPCESVTLCSGTSIRNENCTIHNVNKFKYHENYDYIDYDIAVICVTPAFNNTNTKPVALPSDTSIDKNNGKVCGWGLKEEKGKRASDQLQCADVPYIEQEECKKFEYYDSLLTPRMMCFGFEDGSKDSCQGDSGGPLVNSENILIGITSWGLGCGRKNAPGVYTNVTYFLPWINDTIKTMEMEDSQC